ncbi:MAG: T9SS type A sorting domain-containing protein, partial [Bacteroidota bacterium]|nr:T9SS type A sorting domain-containing protein [Bacteroidota bacterium]
KDRWSNNPKTVPSDPIIYRYKIDLTSMQFLVEGDNPSGGYYKINGIVTNGAYGTIVTIEAFPPSNDYAFYEWSDGAVQNPRTINLTSNTTLYAKAKRHLYTTSSTATASNNQHKIVQDNATNTYCAVYQSVNKVWLTTSSDGTNWSNEVLVSTGDYNTDNYPNTYPSLAASDGIVNVVWQCQEEPWSPFTNCYIYLRRYNLYTHALGPLEIMQTFAPDADNYLATPVIVATGLSPDGSGDAKLIAWKEPNGIAVKAHYPDPLWTPVGYVPGTNSNCYFPSVASYAYVTNAGLCYEDDNSGGGIIEFTEPTYSTSWQFNNSTQVSPYGWAFNQHPLIVRSNTDKPTIVWESYGNTAEGVPAVHMRQRTTFASNGTFGNITSFTMSTTGSLYPTVGTHPNSDALQLLWEQNGNVYSARYELYEGYWYWYGISLLASGASGGSGLSITPLVTTTMTGLWKKSDGHLSVVNGIDQLGKSGKGNLQKSGDFPRGIPLAYHVNHHALVELQSLPELNNLNVKGLIGFEVTRFEKDPITPIGFFSVDTLFTHDSTEVHHNSQGGSNTLRSDKFSVQNNSDTVTLAGAYYAKGLQFPPKASLSDLAQQIDGSDLAVVTLKDNTISVKGIWKVPFSHLAKAASGTDGEFRKIPISLDGLAGKDLFLDVAMLGSGEGIHPIIVNDYLILSDQDQQMEQFSKSAPRVITDYALFQNYPNPFNPTTEIDYQLKEDGKTRLAVYDVLGREVAVLVDEYKSAGYYSAQFDAHAFSSGVYFYRLMVNNNNGRSLFSDTKRLVLMK